VEPTNPDDTSFRFDVSREARVFEQETLKTLANIKASSSGTTVKVDGIGGVSVMIDASQLLFTVLADGKAIATLNEDLSFFYEIGRKHVDPENGDQIDDTFPNGASALGIGVSFKTAAYLTGMGERNAGMNLEDGLYRSYNVDSYTRYGTCALVIAHTAGYSAGVYWSNPSDTFAKVSTGSGTSDVRFVSEGGFLDLFLFAEPVSQIVPHFMALTGAPFQPPAWVFGYHQCKWGYTDEEMVLDVLNGFETSQIPFDVLWLDIDHLKGDGPFEWNHETFPAPEKIVDMLTQAGRRMVRICDCHLTVSGDNVQGNECVAKGYAMRWADGSDYIAECWPGNSVWPDFLSSDVSAWYSTKYYYGEGRDFTTPIMYTWNDMNENSVFTNGQEGTFPKMCRHIDGVYEVRETHSLYGMLQTAATHKGLIERNAGRNDRPFVLTRSWYPGIQRYSWAWSGDNNANWGDLQNSLPMTMIAGFGSLPIGQDCGGFNGNPSDELYVRWLQAAAVTYPFFRIHCSNNDPRREPFLYEGDTRKQLEAAIQKRYSLIGVWYTAALQQIRTGRPPIAPLWFDWPDVASHHTLNHELILAETFLAAPVVYEGAKTWAVTFPPGKWRPFTRDSAAWYSDGTVSFDVTLDDLPFFIKGGKIAPVFDKPGSNALTTLSSDLTLVIAPDDSDHAEGVLLLDDGTSYNFQKGEFLHLKFEYTSGSLSTKKIETESAVPALFANSKVTQIVVYRGEKAESYSVSFGLAGEWTWRA
jgi:alpha 1,3-glucosidase